MRGEAPPDHEINLGLRYLNLSGNEFTYRSVVLLVTALESDKYIKSIDLSRMDLTDEGVEEMVSLLEKSPHMISLKIDKPSKS